MAIVTCKIAERSLNLVSRPQSGGSLRVIYKLETDAVQGPIDTYTQGQAVTDPNDPLPARWQQYDELGESDTALYCSTISLRRVSTTANKKWTVTCDYATLAPGQLSGDGDTNPFARPVHYWLEEEYQTVPIEQGKNLQVQGLWQNGQQRDIGQLGPIENGANQPFDETLTKDRSYSILCAQKNFASLDSIRQIKAVYEDTMNSDEFYGVPPRHAEFRSITTSRPIEEDGTVYWSATIRIALNENETWDRYVVNRGKKYWDNVAAKLEDFEQSEPQNLTTDGLPVAQGKMGNLLGYEVHSRVVPYIGLGILIGVA